MLISALMESLIILITFIIFLNCNTLLSMNFIVSFLEFIPFFLHFFFKYSFKYFKTILSVINLFRLIFFVSFLPVIFQFFLLFHFYFDYIWDLYLLLVIYSFLLILLPYYFYLVYTQTTTFHISIFWLKFELKTILVFILFTFIKFERGSFCVSLILLFECTQSVMQSNR
jgi:hypothetical protein